MLPLLAAAALPGEAARGPGQQGRHPRPAPRRPRPRSRAGPRAEARVAGLPSENEIEKVTVVKNYEKEELLRLLEEKEMKAKHNATKIINLCKMS